MIRFIIICLFIFANTLELNGKEYNNNEYRFAIDLPNELIIQEYSDSTNNLLLTAHNKNIYIEVIAYKSNDGVYNVPTILKQIKREFSSNSYTKPTIHYDPWTNILRNNIRISNKKDNIYIERLIIFRAETLFDIRVYSDNELSQFCEDIFSTVDLDLTLYSKLRIAQTSIDSTLQLLISIIYFNLYILLGRACRIYRDRKDNKHRILTILISTFVVIPLILIFYLLRNDLIVALLVVSTIALLGTCLMSNTKMLLSFVKSILE